VVCFALSHHLEQAMMYQDEEDNTVLHHAVWTSNNANILEAFLLANPMEAQVPNQLGLLPLHVALWKCHVKKSIVQ
jgi:ankyrin repeat protein